MRGLLVAVMILAAAPAFGQAPPITIDVKPAAPSGRMQFFDRASESALWFSVGADIGTTAYGIKKDGKVESNPVLQRNGRNILRIAGTSIGLTAAADFAAHRMTESGHPKAAIVSRFLSAGLHLFVAFHNNLK